MSSHTIKLISIIFILSSVTLFISTVILVFLKYRSLVPMTYDLKEEREAEKKPKQRRLYERIRYAGGVKVFFPEKEIEFTAYCQDIHHYGVGLCLPVNIEIVPGVRLEIELLLEGEDRPIRVGAQVVWTEELENKEMERLTAVSEVLIRRTGLRFVDVEEEERKKIEAYINRITERDKQKE